MKSPYTFKHIAPTNNSEEHQGAIFLFHGLGSNEEDLLQLVEEFKGQCHIFSLRGPITHTPGFAFYTFEEEGKPTREVFDKMITFTQSFIIEAIDQFHLDINKIFLIGFNQGAAVVETLTLTLGNLVNAAVALSGYLPEFVMNEYKKVPLERTKIFISHGEYDYDFPIQWGLSSKNYFEEIGVQVTFKTYPDGHGVTPENLKDMVDFIAVNLVDTVN
ncbi:alpha/beta hydrolase [Ureibacillus aquaedulcis]|uniref:Esterase n=1 Tax=Ureibacillus aquaedulcis TaxID=3058421 RepID=A0ABT8GPC5_9BACL|nr:esterase [Ureibacillus sp. BA0131]MDN4493267.1 esterase [Ureibacillus sp. BA0131]